MKTTTVIKLLFGLILSIPLAGQALTVTEDAKLEAGQLGEEYPVYGFGQTLALQGNTAIVSTLSPAASPKVYVFDRNDTGYWIKQTRLLPDIEGREFALSVDLDNDSIILGGVTERNTHGIIVGTVSIYIRDASGHWIRQTKLQAADGAENDFFGKAVAIDEDTAIIGAFGESSNKASAGAAYVFVRNSRGEWSQQAKLQPSDLKESDNFGWSVAIHGNTAVVGARNGDGVSINSGTAYVFVRDSNGHWNQLAKLHAADGTVGDVFGQSVAIDDDTALIGAWYDDNSQGHYAGAVYVFNRDDDGHWKQNAKLLPDKNPNGSGRTGFGISLSLDGNNAVIGSAYNGDDVEDSNGAAYLFVRDLTGKWIKKAKLLPSDPPPSELFYYFGYAVAVDDDTIFISRKNSGSEIIGQSSGAVYIYNFYSFLAPQCNGQDANIYVSNRQIIGGPMDGQAYQGVLAGTRYGDDVIVGTHANDQIFSHGGNDTICGLKGDDSIYGSKGNDLILGGPGDDILLGEDDDDVLKGEAGNDLIQGDNGNDDLNGGEGDDVLSGGAGNDVMRAYQGNDVLWGGGGTDRLDGGPGKDILNGGWQYDVCIAGEVHARCEDIRQ